LVNGRGFSSVGRRPLPSQRESEVTEMVAAGAIELSLSVTF
jgi:hypothetical protein